MDAIVKDKYGHGIDIKTPDVMNNGKYIYNGTGASFHMIPAVVHMIQTDADFAQKVVDVIFNDRKLDDSLANMFEEKFREHMKEAVEHENNHSLIPECLNRSLIRYMTNMRTELYGPRDINMLIGS